MDILFTKFSCYYVCVGVEVAHGGQRPSGLSFWALGIRLFVVRPAWPTSHLLNRLAGSLFFFS